MRRHELTDHEWSVIEPLLPRNSRGVPRVDDRRVINGILWRFRTGSSWRDVPERYGPRTTLYNRFTRWRAAGVLDTVAPGATVIADKAYDTDGIRSFVAARGAWANIPPRSTRKATFAFSRWVYRQRNLVERFFNRIKQMRGLATRYDRRPENYLAAIKLAAIRIWINA